MSALRLFASGSSALLLSLAGCSLVIDTDAADPQVHADSGRGDSDAGTTDLGKDLGALDLAMTDLGALDSGTIDLGDVDLGSEDLGSEDLGRVDLGADDGGVDLGSLDLGPGTTCTGDGDCDDGVECTDDRCPFGRCTNLPIPLFCDDGATCTLDLCVPTTLCAGTGSTRVGCEHRAVDDSCAAYAVRVIETLPALACAPVVCLGATARNLSGCGFGESRCAFGATCMAGVCSAVVIGDTCDEASDCTDGNPCNGVEGCGSRGAMNVCVPALTTPCRSTPSGVTLPGSCALEFSSSGGFLASCAPPPDSCTTALP